MKTKPRILIVEDDFHQRTLLALAAQHSHMFSEVRLAANGQVALDLLARAIRNEAPALPDLILSDLEMPMIDGISLIGRVKADPITHHIPVAVLTSSSSPEARDQAFSAGCSAFFSKPIRFDELTAMMTRVPAICGIGG